MDWDDLRYFLCVARTGGLSAAAAAIGSSSATVGRKIDALETAVGTKLFTRSPTGYDLNTKGRAFLLGAEQAEASMTLLFDQFLASDAQPVGPVRLATPPEFAEYLVVPRLPALLERYPGLELSLMTGVDVVDINRSEADIAFRSIRPDQGERTRVRRLADFPFALYGSIALRERFPGSEQRLPEDIPLITRVPAYERLITQQWIMGALPTARSVLRITSLREAVAACRLGIGATVLPRFIAETEPDLVPIGPDPAFLVSKWMLIHSGVAETARIRVVVEWLIELFAAKETIESARGHPDDSARGRRTDGVGQAPFDSKTS